MLNEPQEQAVRCPGGPLLVFAGAGSGKTATITHRVAYLIRELGVQPDRILCVTFTNKAAGEMRERLNKLLGVETTRALHWLGTFHATGARMLRAMSEHVSRKPDFSIYDEHDQLTVMKHVVEELGVDKKWYKPQLLVDQLTKAKERGFSPDDIPEIDADSRVFRRAYERYETWLEAANAFDFEDLLLVPMRLAEAQTELGARMRARFDHVLVDEFQDTSHTQYKLVKALAGPKQNLTVVGDDDQCHLPGTRITVPHSKRIDHMCDVEHMKDGDLVRSFNMTTEKHGRSRRATVASRDYQGKVFLFHAEPPAGFRLYNGHSHVVPVTPDHRMIARDAGTLRVIPAFHLAESTDRAWEVPVYKPSGSGGRRSTDWQRLRRVEVGTYEGPVYSLDVEHDHAYFANNIAVHNCIYEWRSADVKLIRNFKKDFPSATVIKLEQNYRSTGHIVRAALEVIQKSPFRVDKRLWTDAGDGSKIRIVECATDRHEGRFIASELHEMLLQGMSLSSAAILYRTHQVARAIEEPLRDRGIPYVILGGPRFYDRKEIRDVLAYFRLAANASSNVDLIRAIGSPARGIGSAKVLRLSQLAKAEGTSLFKAIPSLLASGELRPKEHQALEHFHELFRAAHAMRATKQPPLAICKRLIEESGYHRMWTDAAALAKKEGAADDYEDATTRAENVLEILSAVGSYEEDEKARGRRPSLDGYLERVALMTEPNQPGEGKVTLMTIHAAKGLEYEHVFVAGCEEGTLPLGNATQDPASLDEERRLAYVAVTRARQALALTWAAQRFVRGKVELMRPSRLFDAISDEIVDVEEA